MQQVKNFSIDYSKFPSQWTRIVIDGDQGAGKTTLANEIAEELNASVISLDEFLLGNHDDYWKQINYDSLRSKIMSSGAKIIIEGVCILKILAQIQVRHDYHIFVELRNGFVGWEYGHYLSEKSKPPRSKLMQDIIAYYREFRPFESCDLFLSRELVGSLKEN
jgi:hypothetical protein